MFNHFVNKYSNIVLFSTITATFSPLNILYKNYSILIFDTSTLNVIIIVSFLIFIF